MGFAYARLGEIYQGLERYEDATIAFQQSLQIREVLGEKTNLVTAYTRIGLVETLNKRHENALYFHQKALKLAREIAEDRNVAGCLDHIASTYTDMKQYEKAKIIALEGLQIAVKLRAKLDECNSYATLARLFEDMGSYKEAYNYTRKYLHLHDSIDNIEKSAQLAKIQTIYDIKKKIQENALLKKDRELDSQKQARKDILLISIAGVLLLTLVGIYVTLRSRQKQVRLNALIQVQKQELERKNTKIERNINIVLELSKNEAIADGDWGIMAQEVTKAIVEALGVRSSQLWYYNFKEDIFYCVGECGGKVQILEKVKVPLFNQLLETEKPLVIADIKTQQFDTETTQFFLQKQIGAAIIFPNVLSEKQKGILIACEDSPKEWDIEDKAFMKSMEDEIVIAYQGFRRKQAQEEIEKQNKEIAEKNESLRTTLRLVKKEQKRTDELLLNILPFQVAEELKAYGHTSPMHYELVTVLFTDFSGFTQIAERLTPQEVIAELDICFLAFDEICDKYNLEKIKTIGDAYMCAGGIPIANQTNPVDAVRAAREMQVWLEKWAKEKRAKGLQAWEIRIGIHSGEVVAGIVGKRKFAYDIWGDAVNTASRMESSGEVGKINISGTTYRYVKDHFKCVFRGKVQAKNKGEIDMYFVEGEI